MDEIKEKRLQVRVTPSELEEINKVANSLGLPTSQFVLMALKQTLREGLVLGKSVAPEGQSLAVNLN